MPKNRPRLRTITYDSPRWRRFQPFLTFLQRHAKYAGTEFPAVLSRGSISGKIEEFQKFWHSVHIFVSRIIDNIFKKEICFKH